jgi:KipI family sensor histidine kinase inhibitor
MSDSYPRVLPVGDRALTVVLGASLDHDTVARVRSLDARLREFHLPGILETVPTYASLLAVYDREQTSFPELKTALQELAQNLGTATSAGRLVQVPAVYDGDDLDDVSKSCGLSKEAVIDKHSGRDYTVLMLGFSPGFAYMGFVDEALRLPRRKTPRTRVPAGSIGIAGVQTGIYPRSLPGGWNLLGRTSLRLFDPLKALGDASTSPSFFVPGDRVRFVPTSSLEPAAPTVDVSYRGTGVSVVEPGVLSTIQDGGRSGLRRVGVPLTGFADRSAARMANTCVGNAPDAPLVEICAPGLRLAFEKTSFIAVTGARVTASLERGDLQSSSMDVPMNVALRVRPSNTLSITRLEEGVRAYIAIAGLDAPRLLGSASVDLGSALLRPLQSGDGFSIDAFDSDRAQREPIRTAPRAERVRLILGPQLDHFDQTTVETLLGAAWRTGLDSDRVGARLDGPRLRHSGSSEIVSDGMVPGCIQVPPDGRPIVMLPDCPTTGGYPKIACVVSDDLDILAQAIPGRTEIRFVAVQVEDL